MIQKMSVSKDDPKEEEVGLVEEGTMRSPATIDNNYDTSHPQQPTQQQLRKSHRTQMLLSALLLCTLGLSSQFQTLQTLSSRFSSSKVKPQHEMDKEAYNVDDLFIPSMEYNVIKGISSETRPASIFDAADCSRPAKEADWDWYNTERIADSSTPSLTTQKQEPRLLIALFAGYDKYADILQNSAHLAKVYASLHSATTSVVVLQGTAFAPHNCSPPAIYSTLNKIRLLFHAIDHKEDYDQLLLLEADALIVNMNVDITTLLPDSNDNSHVVLLAAQQVRQGNNLTPPPRHHINTGATLWNLHHADVAKVALEWFELAKSAAIKGQYRGDQKYLQSSLEDYDKHIHLLDDEFAYTEGTVVQHYLKHSTMKWADRRAKIQNAARSVCSSLPNNTCEAVPRKEYPMQ